MSFGFAVGDFVAAITLIRDVASALDSATGSVSEVKLMSTALSSLEKSILITKDFYEKFPPAATIQAHVEIAKSIYAAVKDQVRLCVAVIDTFYRSFKAYSSSLIEGRGSLIARSFRKITWLRKRDDLIIFVRNLDSHLKALNNYNALLSLLQSSENNQLAQQILAGNQNLQTDVTKLTAAVTKLHEPLKLALHSQNELPVQLGYPWEAQSSMKDVVLLHDAIGRKVTLPLMLLGSYRDFHELVLQMYQGIPARPKIKRKEYAVIDGTSDDLLIEESNWHESVRPGTELTLSMKLPAPIAIDKHMCPQCKTPTSSHSLPGKRRRCHKCQQTFWVTETKIVFEEEEPPSTPAEAKEVSETNDKDEATAPQAMQVDKSSKPIISERVALLFRNRARRIEDSIFFFQVHYHRQDWVVKQIPATLPAIEVFLDFSIDRLPPLHRAAADGSIPDIEQCIGKGMSIDTPLAFELQYAHPNSIAKYFKGCTPLQIACWFGHRKTIIYLLDNGAAIEIVDAKGYHAVNYAVQGKRPDCVWILVQRGANLHHKFVFCPSLLRDAYISGQSALISYLHEEDQSYAEMEMYWNVGITMFMLALELALEDCFDLLLEYMKPSSLFQIASGPHVLHRAVSGGSVRMVKYLLDTGVEVDPVVAATGSTPLHYACMLLKEDLARILIEAGADFSRFDWQDTSFTPIHAAAYRGLLETLKLMKSRSADLHVRNKSGHTPLHYAARYGHVEVVEYILSYNETRVNDRAEDGATPLYYAVRQGHIACARLLLSMGADVESTTNSGSRPLWIAARMGHATLIEMLLDQRADHGARDSVGATAFHVAAEYGHINIMKILHERGADITARDRDGDDALITAASKGQTATVEYLLQLGMNINVQNDSSGTPLFYATDRNQLDVVEILLARGARTDIRNVNSAQPLHVAAKIGNTAMIKLLLSHGADISARGHQGYTPLYYTIMGGTVAAVELLLSRGADPSTPNDAGYLPVHSAAYCQTLPMLQLLLEASDFADINYDAAGLTSPLVQACRRKDRHSYEIAKFLLTCEKPANANASSVTCPGALFDAVYFRCDRDLVRILVAHGADVNRQFIDGRTVMRYAVIKEDKAMMDLLVSCGARANEHDREWWNSLPHHTAFKELITLPFEEVVEMFKPYFTGA